MDTNILKVFRAVALEGSISKAAQSLNYVQSNVTTRIQQLEEDLKTPLFYRHSRGITLTSAGKTLLTYTDKILYLLDEAYKAVQDSPVPRGTISIGVVDTIAAVRLPSILSAYHREYPDVEFNLVADRTKQLVQEVLEYNIDGAFVDGPIDHPELIQQHIVDEELILVFNPSLIPFTSLNDIQHRTLLLENAECTHREKMESWLQQEGLLPMRIMVLGALEGILECVKSGMGVSLITKSFLQRIEIDRSIECFSIPERFGRLSTVHIRRNDFYMTSAMVKLVDMVKEHSCKE